VKAVIKEEAEMRLQLEEARKHRETCEQKFVKVIAHLNTAVEELYTVKKEEIDEIKSYRNPSPTLRTLMQAICLVLRVSPAEKDDYWSVGIGPQVLGDMRIL
jgi:hypothetical protein